MSKKGFTVIEFLVSFCLATTISFLLFQIIVGFKDLYIKGNIETAFETKKSNILKLINNDLNSKDVYLIQTCGDECIEFSFSDLTVKQLKVENGIIKYDNYSIKPIDGSTIGKISITNLHSTTSAGHYNSVLNVKIPLKNKLSEKNFDIDFVYLYNSTDVTVTY